MSLPGSAGNYHHDGSPSSSGNPRNRYVYLRQNYQEHNMAAAQAYRPDKIASRVLVNPRFRKVVYVNPNFQQPHHPNTRSNVHVNPIVFSRTVSVHVQPNTIDIPDQNPYISEINPYTAEPNASDLDFVNSLTYQRLTSSVSTPSGLNLNSDNDQSDYNGFIEEKNETASPPNKYAALCKKRRTSLRNPYKIVRSTNNNNNNNSSKSKSTPQKLPDYSSKYKIIRNLPQVNHGKTIVKVKNKNNLYKVDKRLLNKSANNSKKNGGANTGSTKKKFVYLSQCLNPGVVTRNLLLKNNPKFSKIGLVYLNGVLYKTSPNSIQRASICGKKENNKSLNNSVRKTKYKIVKNAHKIIRNKQQKLDRKSKQKNVSPSKLKKSNVPCSIYRKFGKCRGKNEGTCIKTHDPKKIVLCTRFLQGACLKKNCPLSHKVSKEKMPTCKYYLEGLCSREDCQYLHVKMSPKTDICKDFLEGYCEKGAQCDKRHQFLCPDFEKNGACPQRRCPYPHGNAVRKNITVLNKFAKKCSNSKKFINNLKQVTEEEVASNDEKVVPKKRSEKASSLNSARYYEDDKIKTRSESNNNNSKNGTNENCENKKEKILPARPKLGVLPAYIPLNVKDKKE